MDLVAGRGGAGAARAADGSRWPWPSSSPARARSSTGRRGLGLGGRPFDMLKFRSMRIDAERQTGPVWAARNDDRCTPLGRFMRRWSLDELPQLFNVLAGDMSLVGPRPERSVFVEQFRRQIPDYAQRHQVKAGMTGWAQVHGWRGNTSLRHRLRCDLYYISHWSLWLDLQDSSDDRRWRDSPALGVFPSRLSGEEACTLGRGGPPFLVVAENFSRFRKKNLWNVLTTRPAAYQNGAQTKRSELRGGSWGSILAAAAPATTFGSRGRPHGRTGRVARRIRPPGELLPAVLRDRPTTTRKPMSHGCLPPMRTHAGANRRSRS